MVRHLILAVLIQLAVAIPSRSWFAGAAAASAWAISRELTQAEYRWIEQFGGGLRANMPWWGGFDLRVWQGPDPWLDWTAPSLLTVLIALVANRLARRDRLKHGTAPVGAGSLIDDVREPEEMQS